MKKDIWWNTYTNHTYLIIIQYIHILKQHIVLGKHIQLSFSFKISSHVQGIIKPETKVLMDICSKSNINLYGKSLYNTILYIMRICNENNNNVFKMSFRLWVYKLLFSKCSKNFESQTWWYTHVLPCSKIICVGKSSGYVDTCWISESSLYGVYTFQGRGD